jgi:hypothetical protein
MERPIWISLVTSAWTRRAWTDHNVPGPKRRFTPTVKTFTL